MDRLANFSIAVFLTLSLIALLLPNHYYPWGNFHQEFLSYLGLLLLATGLVSVIKSISVPQTNLIIAAIALLPLLQYASGVIFFWGDAFLTFAYIAGLTLSITVGYNWQRYESKKPNYLIDPLNALMGYLLAAALLSTGIAIYQWLGLNNLGYLIVDIGPGVTPGGNLSQRNNFGSLTSLGIVAAFYFRQRKILTRPSFILLIAFLTLALAICQSRTPWLIALCSIGWVFFQRKAVVSSVATLISLFAIVFFYLLLTLVLLPVLSDLLLLSHDSYLRSAEIGGRRVLWRSLLSAVFLGDWFGYGWGQVSIAQIAIADQFPNGMFTEYSHNLFLDLLLWNGPVLGLLLIGLIFAWGYRQIKTCCSENHVFTLWAIGVLAVHSMLEYPFAYAYFLLPAGLLVGVTESMAGTKSHTIKHSCWISIPLLAVFSVALLLVFRDYQIAEAKHRQMRFASAGFVGSEKMHVPAGDILVLTQLSSFLTFTGTLARENMTFSELESMEKAATRYAYPPSLFRYALALGLNYKFDESRRILAVLQNTTSAEIYGEAFDNWALMVERYPQLSQVAPPPIDRLYLEKH